MKLKSILLTQVAIAAFSISGTYAATLFSNIYTFGDSLSDVGNTSLATGGTLPGAGYAGGRYSNGPLWVETLADRLGVPAITPSAVGGTGHAWAGAFTGGTSILPTLQQQAALYVGNGGSFLPTDLVTVWGGANDFIIAGQLDPLVPAANISTTITTLASGGAKHILLMNLPDLGDTPEIISTGNPLAIAGFSQLSLAYNMALAAAVPDLETSLGIQITLLDIYSIGKDIKNNPGNFGFTNTTEGAFTSGNVADVAEYVYWDDIHPTTRVHDIFADRAFTAIPEPSAILLLGVFCSTFLLRRARKCA